MARKDAILREMLTMMIFPALWTSCLTWYFMGFCCSSYTFPAWNPIKGKRFRKPVASGFTDRA